MNARCCQFVPLFVFLIADVSIGRANADQFEPVRELIRRKLEQKEAPSITVAVARNGEILWEEGFGWVDKEHKRSASANTPYRLGSVSKPITVTAVMVLRERGVVDLDRPINDYMGEVKLRAAIGDVSGATVRRVIQHMAGLPEHSEAYYLDEPGQVPSLDLAIRRYGVLTRPPGDRFVYSNLGYAALGGVVTHVSGKSYDEFLHDEVFVPLGMKQAAAPGPHLRPERAVGYLPDGGREVDYTRSYVPAADVYASANDLARFGLFHLKAHLQDQRQLFSDKTIDEMKESAVPMGDASYGLGWHIRKDSKSRLQVLHGGASAGTDAQFTLVPEEKLCVVVLANVTRHWPGAMTEQITNAILAEVLGGKPDDFPTLLPDTPPKTTGLPGKLEGKWAGKVHTHQGDLDLTIWCGRDGTVLAQLGKQAKTSVRQAQLNGTAFTGKMDGDIGTDDARRRAYELEWNAALRGDVLNGTLYATTRTTRPLRLGFWVELQRAKPTSRGDWIGELRIGDRKSLVDLKLDYAEPSPAGTITYPVTGGKPIALSTLSAEEDQVRFSWPDATGRMTFEGTISNGILAGEIRADRKVGNLQLVPVTRLEHGAQERLLGDYELSPGHLLSITSFPMGPAYTDYASGRAGVLFPSSATEFFAGPAFQVPVPITSRARFSVDEQGKITGIHWKEGADPELFGKKVELPKEEVVFRNGDVVLTGTLVLPVGQGPHPAIVMIHGSGPQTRRSPVATWYAYHGIAYLSFDKRGAGKSTGDWREAGLSELTDDVLAAVKLLRQRKEIDGNQIIIEAISEGGWVAPVVAVRDPKIRSIILVAGPALDYVSELLNEVEENSKARGLGGEDLKKALEFKRQALAMLKEGAGLNDEAWERFQDFVRPHRSEKWFRYVAEPEKRSWAQKKLYLMSQVDTPKLWQQITIPVFASYGGKDLNVPAARNIAALEEALQSARNRDYRIKLYPNINHNGFETDSAVLTADQQRYLQRLPPGIFSDRLDWVLSHVRLRKAEGPRDTTNSIGMRLVPIPVGEFDMYFGEVNSAP
jgi:CubicO group peptidase (beta-lactamase class C family)/pimeloyl-ACP methyl ester carboxylesterase